MVILRQQGMLVCMVNEIIEELRDLDMELKPESLWWTSTYEGQRCNAKGGELEVTPGISLQESV